MLAVISVLAEEHLSNMQLLQLHTDSFILWACAG